MNAANDAFDGNHFDVAERLATWIYGYPAAAPQDKAHAAVIVATVYGQRSDVQNTIEWYRRALRYDPDNQRYKDAIRDLGGTP